MRSCCLNYFLTTSYLVIYYEHFSIMINIKKLLMTISKPFNHFPVIEDLDCFFETFINGITINTLIVKSLGTS